MPDIELDPADTAKVMPLVGMMYLLSAAGLRFVTPRLTFCIGCSTGDTAGGLEAYRTRTRQHRNHRQHRIHGYRSTPRGI